MRGFFEEAALVAAVFEKGAGAGFFPLAMAILSFVGVGGDFKNVGHGEEKRKKKGKIYKNLKKYEKYNQVPFLSGSTLPTAVVKIMKSNSDVTVNFCFR